MNAPSRLLHYYKNLFRQKNHNYLISKVKKIYAEIDRALLKFQVKSKLSCATGCGKCCLSPHIETTILEMYPLAEYLLESGQAAEWYQKLLQLQQQGPCIFYEQNPIYPDKGRCKFYNLRPGICRMFGFSAVINKFGQKRLYTCALIKERFSSQIDYLENRTSGIKAPLLNSYTSRISNLHPVIGEKMLPINAAIKSALDRLSYFHNNPIKNAKEVNNMSTQTKQQKPQQQQKKPAAAQANTKQKPVEAKKGSKPAGSSCCSGH